MAESNLEAKWPLGSKMLATQAGEEIVVEVVGHRPPDHIVVLRPDGEFQLMNMAGRRVFTLQKEVKDG